MAWPTLSATPSLTYTVRGGGFSPRELSSSPSQLPSPVAVMTGSRDSPSGATVNSVSPGQPCHCQAAGCSIGRSWPSFHTQMKTPRQAVNRLSGVPVNSSTATTSVSPSPLTSVYSGSVSSANRMCGSSSAPSSSG